MSTTPVKHNFPLVHGNEPDTQCSQLDWTLFQLNANNDLTDTKRGTRSRHVCTVLSLSLCTTNQKLVWPVLSVPGTCKTVNRLETESCCSSLENGTTK